MNAAIVPVPQNGLARIEAAPATPPPGPPRGPRGLPFASIYAEVMQRADHQLPDRVVHVADLRMTPEEHIALPGGAELRLNTHARKMLASKLGLRWGTWFQNTSGEERAEEINRRFSRTPGEWKIKSEVDPEERANGIVRAFLAPTRPTVQPGGGVTSHTKAFGQLDGGGEGVSRGAHLVGVPITTVPVPLELRVSLM